MTAKGGQEERYSFEVGKEALRRQQDEAARGRCPACWAPPGEPHSPLCPNLPEGDEAPAPSQDEVLF